MLFLAARRGASQVLSSRADRWHDAHIADPKHPPDEEPKLANRDAKEQSENPILNWFNTLDNPLNDGSGWFNPLKRS